MPTMLALLHRAIIEAAESGIPHEPIHWWHWADPPPPPPAPRKEPARPPTTIKTEDGRQFLLDYGITTEFSHKLYDGRLRCWGRPGSPLAAAVRMPRGAVIGIKGWWPGGGVLKLADGQLLYDARVEPPPTARMIPENDLADWLRGHPEANDRDDWRAAQRDLGGTIPRKRFRDIREQVIGKHRRGPRQRQ